MSRTVAIVGAGFSGAMLAARLAEQGVRSRLINRTADFGLGVAYSTTTDVHLLNVRTSRMSAIAGEPDHFLRWLSDRHPDQADPHDFAPRRLYGAYVQDRLSQAEATHPGQIERIVGEAVEITGDGVRLADGRTLPVDAVVLATGNPAPATVAPGSDTGVVIGDPWAPGALDAVRPADRIVIIGTGLTMVDVLLSLEERGWVGQACAISRRGLKPRAHCPHADGLAPAASLLTGPLSARLRSARVSASSQGWREVMDGLRPVTASTWGAASEVEQARFLRHLRPWWDVHRHRIAPQIDAQLEALEASGRLDLVAGRIAGVTPSKSGVTVQWRPRGAAVERTLIADRLIDCTGPGYAPEREHPTGALLASGAARLHPLRLGLDIDDGGRVLDAKGQPNDRLFVLGPPARAAFWETVAVPDIRDRIEQIAGILTPGP